LSVAKPGVGDTFLFKSDDLWWGAPGLGDDLGWGGEATRDAQGCGGGPPPLGFFERDISLAKNKIENQKFELKERGHFVSTTPAPRVIFGLSE
jgi:hypothetical protein